MEDNLKNIFDAIQAITTSLAIIIGGIWTYFRFIRHRESCSKVSFDVDVRYIKKINKAWIVELIALIENKSLVRHKIVTSDFTFSLRYLTGEDQLLNEQIGKKETKQLEFPHELELVKDKEKPQWMATEHGYTFIDPGVKQKYSHVVIIPLEARIILLYGRFRFPDKESDFQSSQCVSEVPE